MGDNTIDMVILDIDIGYLVTLHSFPHRLLSGSIVNMSSHLSCKKQILIG